MRLNSQKQDAFWLRLGYTFCQATLRSERMKSRFAAYFAQLLVAVLVLCPLIEAEASSPKGSHSMYCQRAELRVKQICGAIKDRKVSIRAKEQCRQALKRFNARCARKQVCGQPPFKCKVGVACAMVMPPVKTYPSLTELKRAGATLLYYGSCDNQIQ